MAKRRPSGDGMVRKREDGRWEGRIVVGHKDNGDSIFRYISAPTQKELTAKLRQLTESYKGVDLTEESNMTLSVWLDKWLDEYMSATLRPSTLNGYRRSLELHVKPYLGAKPLAKITAADLRSLYRTLLETGRVSPREGQPPRSFRQNGPRHPHHPASRPENSDGAEPDPQQSCRRSWPSQIRWHSHEDPD